MNPERRRILWALAAVVPAGLLLKYAAPGPLHHWGRWHGGALLYEVFWVLIAGAAWPRAPAWRIGAVVLAATGLLEVSQLWHPDWLQALRGTAPGRMLLGTTFDPRDFAYYLAGSALGALLLRRLRVPTGTAAAGPAGAAGGAGPWRT